MTRDQVDALCSALESVDTLRCGMYRQPMRASVQESVPSLAAVRDIAQAVNKRTYKSYYAGLEFEAVDYRGVHFFARTGKVG